MHTEVLDHEHQKVILLIYYQHGRNWLIPQRGDVKEYETKPLGPSKLLMMILRAFNFGEFHNGKAQQSLPESLQRHEPEISHFGSLCHGLCMRILRLIALGLKVRDRFCFVLKARLDGRLGECRWRWWGMVLVPSWAFQGSIWYHPPPTLCKTHVALVVRRRERGWIDWFGTLPVSCSAQICRLWSRYRYSSRCSQRLWSAESYLYR